VKPGDRMYLAPKDRVIVWSSLARNKKSRESIAAFSFGACRPG